MSDHLHQLQELKLFYYICCEPLVMRSITTDLTRGIARRFASICEALGDYKSPSLTYQTDPRWKTADNRRKKGARDADGV